MAILKIVNNHSRSKCSLKKVVDYVLKEGKTTEALSYVYGDFIGDEITTQTVFDQFMRVKQLFDKKHGRMYQHGVISWHKDEAITPETALSFGKDFVSRQYPEHQALVSVHRDREHVHLHFVVNTVSFMDGKMLHWSKHDLKAARELSDQLCAAYGLSVTEKGKHFDKSTRSVGDVTAWNKDTFAVLNGNPKDSFLANCMSAVEQSLKEAEAKEAFCSIMKTKGWNVVWEPTKKHVTFINSEGKRVRDSKLSKLFNAEISKESLTRHFSSAAERQHKRHRRHR